MLLQAVLERQFVTLVFDILLNLESVKLPPLLELLLHFLALGLQLLQLKALSWQHLTRHSLIPLSVSLLLLLHHHQVFVRQSVVKHGGVDPELCLVQIVSQTRILMFQLQDLVLKFGSVVCADLVAAQLDMGPCVFHLDDLKDWSRRSIISMLNFLNLWSLIDDLRLLRLNRHHS